jgi:hypothetical protein
VSHRVELGSWPPAASVTVQISEILIAIDRFQRPGRDHPANRAPGRPAIALADPAHRGSRDGGGNMTRTKAIGLSLVAVLAVTVIAVSGASAFAPEFGRCLKQPTKSLSNFDNGKCVKLASEDGGTESEKLKKGNYQWFSGVVNNKFTTAIKPSTIVTLETVLGTKLVCTGETSTGEYTGPKEVGHVVIKFTGCEAKVTCESAGAGSGRVTTASLAGTLGFETITEDTPARDRLALELHAEGGGNVMEFSCLGLKYVVRGSLLHKITANAMKLTATERFSAYHGKQKPDHFAGGSAGDHILELSQNGNPFEQAGLNFITILSNEEKVEASTIN